MMLQEALTNALVSTGRMSPKDWIEIVSKSVTGSDYARVELYLYSGRKKNPWAYWNICIDLPRALVLWEHSTSYRI